MTPMMWGVCVVCVPVLGLAVLALLRLHKKHERESADIREKLRWFENECAELQKVSALSLREVVVFTDAHGSYHEVIDKNCCDEFATAFLANAGNALISEKREDRLPWPFGDVAYGDVREIDVRMPDKWKLWEKQRILEFSSAGVILWSRWGELVRSLMRDTSLSPSKPLTPEEFAMLIDGDLQADRVEGWVHNYRDHYGFEALFIRIRQCLDEVELRWKKLMQRPRTRQFLRSPLPKGTLPVLELLKTDDGTDEVLAYIRTVGEAGTTYLDTVANTQS